MKDYKPLQIRLVRATRDGSAPQTEPKPLTEPYQSAEVWSDSPRGRKYNRARIRPNGRSSGCGGPRTAHGARSWPRWSSGTDAVGEVEWVISVDSSFVRRLAIRLRRPSTQCPRPVGRNRHRLVSA